MKRSPPNESMKEVSNLNLSQTFKDRIDSMVEQMRKLKQKRESTTASTEQDTKNKV